MRRSLLRSLVTVAAVCASCTTAENDAAVTTTTATTRPTSGAAGLTGTLAYSARTGDDQDVYVASADGRTSTRLTSDPAEEFDPDLSPDGTRVVYRRNARPGSDDADIWIMNVDGSGQRNLTNAPEAANWAPFWMPDGRIGFSSARNSGGVPELWSMAADGSGATRIAEGWCEYASPSPDGSEVVCSAAVGGRYDLVIVSTRDGVRRSLTTTPTTEFGASWSRDGQLISFSRDVDERWQLLVIRPDGSDEREVASEGVFSTWTDDGQLAWTGPGGVHVAAPDGADEQLVDLPADFISWRS